MSPSQRRALDGLVVVDFGQYLAGPLTAMMLADNGAQVIRVDPPGGPRWNHPANAALQRGKRSIVLDLRDPRQQTTARELIGSADVVVEGFRPGVMDRLGLGPDAMTSANPGLVYCSLPGFSRTDPRAGLAAWEGILGAATGHYTAGVALSWSNEQQRDPSFSALPLASTFGAIVALNSILAALLARQQTGLGQTIEVPLFAAMFEGIGINAQKLPIPQTPFGHVACAIEAQAADGRWCYLVMATRRQYRKFAAAFFPAPWRAEGLDDPIRLENDPGLAMRARELIIGLLATRPAAEWDVAVNAAGVPFSPCQTSQEWLHDENARAVRAVIDLPDPELGETSQPGFAVTLDRTPPRAAHPRRALDADREQVLADLRARPSRRGDHAAPPRPLARALDGIRVVDTTLVLAGPTAGRVLAEFGADVVKINDPAYWIIGHLHANSGKRTALVDLTTPAGREVLWPLVERADVFIQNCTQGTADRMGIGEAAVRAHRPDVVYCSVSTNNYDGPRGAFRGYEPFGQAPTGMMLRWGGGVPRLYRFTVCDYASGHLAAAASLLALHHRARTGEGQHVQASLVQSGTLHQLPFLVEHAGRVWDEPAGPAATGWGPLDRLYRASDGWFYLAALGSGDGQAVSAVTGVSEHDEVVLARVFAGDTVQTWISRFQEAGVAAHPLVELEDLMEDPDTREQGLSIMRDFPGVGPVRTIGPTASLSRTPMLATVPVSPPGSDTRKVVAEAGFADRYPELLASGIVADSLPPDEVVVY